LTPGRTTFSTATASRSTSRATSPLSEGSSTHEEPGVTPSGGGGTAPHGFPTRRCRADSAPRAIHEPLERASMDTRELRGARDVVAGLGEHRVGVGGFETVGPHDAGIAEREVRGYQRLPSLRSGGRSGSRWRLTDGPSERHTPLDEVAELAHVPRPASGRERT